MTRLCVGRNASVKGLCFGRGSTAFAKLNDFYGFDGLGFVERKDVTRRDSKASFIGFTSLAMPGHANAFARDIVRSESPRFKETGTPQPNINPDFVGAASCHRSQSGLQVAASQRSHLPSGQPFLALVCASWV